MTVSPENDPRRVGTIWMLNLDEPASVLEPSVAAAFRPLSQDHLPLLASAIGVPASLLVRRFETGRRCYGAWVAEELAAYGWVSFDDEHIGELNLRVRLLPGEVYIWDCATLPVFRRKGLYSSLLTYILQELRRQGLCRAWIGADMENIPSQRGMARAGFHHLADLVVARILAVRQMGVQGRPGIPDQVLAEARRVFLNDQDQIWKSAATSAGQGSSPP